MLTPEWRKSSHSSSNANCVEVAAQWKKSSRSNGQANCVEICNDQTTVAVRDSKDVTGPQLDFTGQVWTAFLSGIKRGEFDL
jgi:hypothetical protein